jgi:hypothetical protein
MPCPYPGFKFCWHLNFVSAIVRADRSRSIEPVLKAGVGASLPKQFDIRRCFARRRSQKLASCEMLLQLTGEPHL